MVTMMMGTERDDVDIYRDLMTRLDAVGSMLTCRRCM